jgi:hypothetical protein
MKGAKEKTRKRLALSSLPMSLTCDGYMENATWQPAWINKKAFPFLINLFLPPSIVNDSSASDHRICLLRSLSSSAYTAEEFTLIIGRLDTHFISKIAAHGRHPQGLLCYLSFVLKNRCVGRVQQDYNRYACRAFKATSVKLISS